MFQVISAAALAATLTLATTSCILLPQRAVKEQETESQDAMEAGDEPPARNVQSTRPSRSRPSAAPARPAITDDNLRLPDMLGLPTERDLRRATNDEAEGDGSGGISARPPAESSQDDD